MTPRAMVLTALLLGAFVAAAGAYGLLYCLSRLWGRPRLKIWSHVSYAVLCAIAAMVVALTPLYFGWKVMIAVSCAVYLMIPPITWRYLTRLHRREKMSDDPGLAGRTNRHMLGLSRRS
jgi:multisubunit Na+/H+ antiporter MnhG subunit